LLGYLLFISERKKSILKSTFTIITITFAYASIALFYLYDPVWFFIDYKWAQILIVSGLAIYFYDALFKRIAILMIAITHGEFLNIMVLSRFYDGLTLGTPIYLDYFVIGCGLVFIWRGFEKLILFMDHQVKKGQSKTRIYE
jgi:hypothetical protein